MQDDFLRRLLSFQHLLDPVRFLVGTEFWVRICRDLQVSMNSRLLVPPNGQFTLETLAIFL